MQKKRAVENATAKTFKLQRNLIRYVIGKVRLLAPAQTLDRPPAFWISTQRYPLHDRKEPTFSKHAVCQVFTTFQWAKKTPMAR